MNKAKTGSSKAPWKRWVLAPAAVLVGLLNGLLGAGGGMVAVPLLRFWGLEQDEAHASSLAITLPLAIASGYLYISAGQTQLSDALIYLPGGFVGAIVGAILLPKIKGVWLRRIFSVLMIITGIRILMR